MPGAVFGNISFSALVVMANPPEVSEQLARRDGPFFLGKRRTILLHGRVEVQLSPLIKLQDSNGGNWFGNRPQTEERRRRGGSSVLQIRHAKSGGPHGFAVQNDRRANPGDAVGRHEAGNRFFNCRALFGGKTLLLS